MRSFVRRFLIGLLTLSFAASGVAARQCDAAHHSTALVAHHTAAGHELHGHSEHIAHTHHASGAAVHQHMPGGPGPIANDHMSAKCCGLCTLVVGVASDPRVAVIFSVSTTSFSEKAEHRSAATVKVDPGIPKLIV